MAIENIISWKILIERIFAEFLTRESILLIPKWLAGASGCSLLSNWQARQQGSHQVPSSVNCNTLAQNYFIPIQLLSCYEQVIYWFFRILKLSYTCAFGKSSWILIQNNGTCQNVITQVVLPLYGMGIVQQVHETFALKFYWVTLLSNCH